MGWIPAGDYEVALQDGKVVCRNAKGRQLKSVPGKLGEDPAVVGLRQLVEWLERHDRSCLDAVERWMIGSLPVPVALLSRVWPDPSWQRVLRDLVVTADGADVAGFLRGADSERGVGIVDPDGDTVYLDAQTIRIPHPVLLADLEDLREFAVELGVEQRVQQLYREVWRRPADLDGTRSGVEEFAGGRYDQLRFLIGRATQLGYQVRGGQAVCAVLDGGRAVEARMWLGDYDGYESTETGTVTWTEGGSALTLDRVPPVAWSEGMRMGAALYAGRTIETTEAAA
ncbi:DUF4132 domain-containing protein [Embleya scabrispora]|uniref:DUF4132 domain-containing protein n=1 Tax=Embleya scabrispora TaxID=159449 RepID=UPI00039CDC28|nr:DUF4132 domain-containing protein [Embleya scabrispora]MYS84454.1 DUF4132 domain-containing protein [Streptomyces sp. SID5474]